MILFAGVGDRKNLQLFSGADSSPESQYVQRWPFTSLPSDRRLLRHHKVHNYWPISRVFSFPLTFLHISFVFADSLFPLSLSITNCLILVVLNCIVSKVVVLVHLSREKERKLLISLSQVFRQIQGLAGEVDSISPSVEQPDKNDECCTSVCENHQCLTDIVATLISFLTLESKYVKHLVGNILVAVSNFITGGVCNMEANWKSFVDLLGICLEVAISNALLQSSGNQIEHLKYDPPGPAVIQMRLKNSNWRTVSEHLRILRAIIKALEEEEEEENEHGVRNWEILLSSLSMCFAMGYIRCISYTWEYH